MKPKPRILFISLLILFGASFYAESQESIELRAVEVSDTLARILRSSEVLHFDHVDATPFQEGNLVDFLSKRVPMNFKNYGPGLLATPSFRGGDANHTQVYWNGMPLNSPLLGTMDFSTLPVHSFNSVEIIGSNASNLLGTGGMGGTIVLSESPDFFHEQGSAFYQVGSFNTMHAGSKINVPFNIGVKKAVVALHSSAYTSENNFPYVDNSGKDWEERVLGDAEFSRQNISLHGGIKPTSKLTITASYWTNTVERSIPQPIISEGKSASQKDIAHRGILQSSFEGEATTLMHQFMVEDNQNQYLDSTINIDNNNTFNSFHNRITLQRSLLKNTQIKGRVGHRLIRSKSENYLSTISANELSAVLMVEQELIQEKIALEAGYRYSYFINEGALLPFGGITLKPFEKLKWQIFSSASQTIRFATLNERYWMPGGNPSLQPEQAQNLEVGSRFSSGQWKLMLTAFHSEFKDRIRWLPNGTIFSPTNVAYSVAKGLEAYVGFQQQWGRISYELTGNLAYTDAVGGANQNELYQLSYIPRLSWNILTTLSIDEWSIAYTSQYIGDRFISNDETTYLPRYFLQSAGIAKTKNVNQRLHVNWGIDVQNLLNWNYQVLPWRPMPVRSFNLNITIQWF